MDAVNASNASVRMGLFSDEVNRVLGGGLVDGSVLLLAGEPGIGKSTIIVQIASHLALNAMKSVVYVSGEETAEQITSRVHRLSLSTRGVMLMSEIEVDTIIDELMQQSSLPCLLIIDSIQTMYTSSSSGSIGSVSQIRESAARLVQFAKATGVAVLLVGHVTKSGLLTL